METERFITLAIHTFHYANILKTKLEREGIEVRLQNVDLSAPQSSAGVRVRIKEADLPFALRIVENPDVFTLSNDAKGNRVILVPVDFSPLSRQAVDVAFVLAAKLHVKIHLLHSYIDPYTPDSLQLTDMLTYETEEMLERKELQKVAEESMAEFSATLKKRIKHGEMPGVTFTTEITEGLPEQSIMQWSKTNSPSLIVMATRGVETKDRELIGSVTAEVLDTVRFPILTVPPHATRCNERVDYARLISEGFRNITMFVTFEQDDYLTLDALQRFELGRNNINISFVKLANKDKGYNARTYHDLLNYAEKRYPECHFSVSMMTIKDMIDYFKEQESSPDNRMPDLIVVPNKRKNAFTRLFNPGIAHRLLFHSDVPMMVVPV